MTDQRVISCPIHPDESWYCPVCLENADLGIESERDYRLGRLHGRREGMEEAAGDCRVTDIIMQLDPRSDEEIEKAVQSAYELGRKEGRREGMLEAAGICEALLVNVTQESPLRQAKLDHNAAIRLCAAAIREKINSQRKASKK